METSAHGLGVILTKLPVNCIHISDFGEEQRGSQRNRQKWRKQRIELSRVYQLTFGR